MSNESMIEQIEKIVVAGASALREALGVPVTARDIQEISDAGTEAPANGVAARAKATGESAGMVVVVGAATELEAAGDGAAIMQGLAGQIAAAVGVGASDGEAVDDIASAGLGESVAAKFELTVSDQTIPVVVAIDLSLFGGGVVDPVAGDAPTVSRATLPPLGHGAPTAGAQDLQVLADVHMKVTVELGHTDLLVRDLLALSEGSVVELDQPPGTPVDVLVNGTRVARGDVVVVDDDLGVRITEVLRRPV
jgi:flagellar motor switch protein FliN/FliY